jgi:Tat protein translocase TatB subunit
LFLFIGESLGLQELIFIGIFALIIFGPRKLPQMARKLGNVVAELRRVTSEFKSNWEKEVDFENFEEDTPGMTYTMKEKAISGKSKLQGVMVPEVKELGAVNFNEIILPEGVKNSDERSDRREESLINEKEESHTDKRDWL